MSSNFKKSSVFLILFHFFNLGCSLFQSNTHDDKTLHYEFEKGKYLVTIAEYEKAEPFLLQTLAREDENYTETLLLLGKVYDQLSQPEKSILNLKDFISRSKDSTDLLKARALLLKNLAKVKVDIVNDNDSKVYLSQQMTLKDNQTRQKLEGLRWALDFKCDQYCSEEILFLKEIQINILYAIEQDPDQYNRAFDILTSRYDFFETYLKEHDLDISYRKKLAQNIYDALQKLKSAHLENGTLGSVKTAKLIVYLTNYQRRIERWIYDQ